VDGTFKGRLTVSTTVLCKCVRQARRSAETSAAGVRTDDISATRRLHTRSASAARRIAATSGSSNSYSYGEGQNWGHQNSKTPEPIVTKFGMSES